MIAAKSVGKSPIENLEEAKGRIAAKGGALLLASGDSAKVDLGSRIIGAELNRKKTFDRLENATK